MAGTDWIEDVERWLEPFVERLGTRRGGGCARSMVRV